MGASGARVAVELARGRGDPERRRPAARRAVERVGDDRQPWLVRDQARARRHLRGRDRRHRRRADLGHAADLDQRRLHGRVRGPRGGPRPAHARRARRGRPADLRGDGTLPSGANDNALQGARLSLRFTWLAESTATGHRADAGPDPAARQPAGRAARRATTNGDPSATVTAEKLISMPAAKKCVTSRRRGQVHAAGRREGQVGRDHRQRQEGRVGEGRQGRSPCALSRRRARSRCRSRRRSPPAARSRSSGPTGPAENKLHLKGDCPSFLRLRWRGRGRSPGRR